MYTGQDPTASDIQYITQNCPLTQIEKEQIVRRALEYKLKEMIAKKWKNATQIKSIIDHDQESAHSSVYAPTILVNSEGQRVFSTPPPSQQTLNKVRQFVQYKTANTLVLNVLRHEAAQKETEKFQERLLFKEMDREQHLLHNTSVLYRTLDEEHNILHLVKSLHRISKHQPGAIIYPSIAYESAFNNYYRTNIQIQQLLNTPLLQKFGSTGESPRVSSVSSTFLDHLPPPPSVTQDRHKRYPYSDYAHFLSLRLDRSLYPQFLPPTFSASSPRAQQQLVAFNRSMLPLQLHTSHPYVLFSELSRVLHPLILFFFSFLRLFCFFSHHSFFLVHPILTMPATNRWNCRRNVSGRPTCFTITTHQISIPLFLPMGFHQTATLRKIKKSPLQPNLQN